MLESTFCLTEQQVILKDAARGALLLREINGVRQLLGSTLGGETDPLVAQDYLSAETLRLS